MYPWIYRVSQKKKIGLRKILSNSLTLCDTQSSLVEGSVNPEIVKNIARCNFLIITVMFIKVYISGIEMSQRIRFWYGIWQKNTDFFEKMKKKIEQKKKRFFR